MITAVPIHIFIVVWMPAPLLVEKKEDEKWDSLMVSLVAFLILTEMD